MPVWSIIAAIRHVRLPLLGEIAEHVPASRSLCGPIVLRSPDDGIAPGLATVTIGITQRIDTSAIFLLVEFLTLADVDHALTPPALAPIVVPVGESLVGCRCASTTRIDMSHIFPARDAKRAGHHWEPVFMGIKRRALETHVE